MNAVYRLEWPEVTDIDRPHTFIFPASFLRVLVSRTEWSHDELEAVASDMELMLDGALEQINDMAFEHFDMPVTEGEDPFEVNPDIMDKLPL